MKGYKTSAKWYSDFNMIILDPDGWDRKNYDFSWHEEEVTWKEFNKRVLYSTIRGAKKCIYGK